MGHRCVCVCDVCKNKPGWFLGTFIFADGRKKTVYELCRNLIRVFRCVGPLKGENNDVSVHRKLCLVCGLELSVKLRVFASSTQHSTFFFFFY